MGNKADLVEYSSLELVLPIMNNNYEVETCVEVGHLNQSHPFVNGSFLPNSVQPKASRIYLSCFITRKKQFFTRRLLSIRLMSETLVQFWFEIIIEYLFNQLTDNCRKGLTRIFKLCDRDNDGLLNDHELNEFQRRCFDSPLQPQALEDVKNILKRSIPDGVFDNALTLSGFLFLHTLFIQRGRHETTWTVLRKFGYDDSVRLSHHYLRPDIKVPDGCSTELTSQGYDFLKRLFHKYDKDNDGALSPTELANMFSVCDSIPVWVNDDLSGVVDCNEKGWLTLQGFLAIWTYVCIVK